MKPKFFKKNHITRYLSIKRKLAFIFTRNTSNSEGWITVCFGRYTHVMNKIWCLRILQPIVFIRREKWVSCKELTKLWRGNRDLTEFELCNRPTAEAAFRRSKIWWQKILLRTTKRFENEKVIYIPLPCLNAWDSPLYTLSIPSYFVREFDLLGDELGRITC